ncbi:EGF domain-containing protein [Myxococcus stipitatus]|uniref:EGF domain-containing protein n=1 Tax=Myxococcus stipitatus TaxID=83455 RepID=UPI001F3B60F6|nr:EGF domain-containing protein [Myxococcus stipitatus]MCE9673222.1 EGF domain-containing protein [Myxococcus stipitatus]
MDESEAGLQEEAAPSELAVVDPYADAVAPGGVSSVLNPQNAVGAPDGNVATMLALLGGSLVLDMGAGEEGTGPLRVYYQGLTVVLVATVEFLRADMSLIATGQAQFLNLGSGTFSTLVPYSSTTPYRYVRLRGVVLGVYMVDAVEATGPLCGDGRVTAGEGCDDGNRVSKDGCTGTTCRVEPGFTCQGQPSVCTDINECANGTATCSVNATCTNTRGSYTCTCKAGYTGNGKTCTDINECTNGTATCSVNATCANTQGSYTCTCKSGYSGNGRTCNDINECTNGTATCSVNATCSNTQGSYTCACKPGYSGDGRTCNDINECTNGTHTCQPGQRCVNRAGGFDCVPGSCPPPLVLCGGLCVNASTDGTNCGCCGNRCGTGKTCSAGVCTSGASPLAFSETSVENTSSGFIVRTPTGLLVDYSDEGIITTEGADASGRGLEVAGWSIDGEPPMGTYDLCRKTASFEGTPGSGNAKAPFPLRVTLPDGQERVLTGTVIDVRVGATCSPLHPSYVGSITLEPYEE